MMAVTTVTTVMMAVTTTKYTTRDKTKPMEEEQLRAQETV
jgi:hypothetical protein